MQQRKKHAITNFNILHMLTSQGSVVSMKRQGFCNVTRCGVWTVSDAGCQELSTMNKGTIGEKTQSFSVSNNNRYTNRSYLVM